PLLRRALAAPMHRARATPPGAPPLASPLARAAALHLGVLAGPERVEARALRDLGRAWQAAIDDEGTAGALLARELALGADGRSDALRRVAERATDELSWLIERGRVPLRRVRGRGLIAAAGARVRDRLLGELQEEAERIHARALDPDQDVLTPAEEWRAIARLRERHAAAVAVLGAEGRRIAWEIVHPALSAVAVRLFNVRLERSIAHATFRFLAAEAEAVGDGENQGIHERNQLCGW
ncbi:MAG TPA: hypothetical protein VLT47_00695, partial [Anaeromyxobacteraceae bacterium]|nr:hypothetical protein [Anaeromyxobacteraceae bacterium]